MTCEKIQERFADYLTGDHDEAGRADVQAHILGCKACREDLEDLTVVWAKLGVLPEEQPGGAVRSRFYAMLEDAKAALEAERKAAAQAARRPRFSDWFTFRRPGRRSGANRPRRRGGAGRPRRRRRRRAGGR